MHVKSLFLQHFRSFTEGHFDFCPSLNLLCGPNARGKTSVLEALFLLIIGRSFRPGVYRDLIHHDHNEALIEAQFYKHSIDQKLKMCFFEKERKIIHNHTIIHNNTALLGTLQGVVMVPDDTHLIKGTPALRRQFIDAQIAQVDPLYIYFLSRYLKAMAHRNALIKQKTTVSMDSFENEMARAAAYITLKRRSVLNDLESYTRTFYSFLTNERETLSLTYQSPALDLLTEQTVNSFYKEQYRLSRPKEMRCGYTLIGPHKEDFKIYLQGNDVKYFASEGQQRSVAVALRMGEWHHLKQQSSGNPLLMIDDFGISFDTNRKKRLLEWISTDLGQVFITTTDEALLDNYQKDKNVISI